MALIRTDTHSIIIHIPYTMSGHSHWATHKHQKSINDAKRGIIFTKYGRLITIAAREGGNGNPDMNFKLRIAIDQAKSVNMPKENIDRAIKVGTGESKDGVQIEEILYEGYGPGQTALIIETVTDNRNRTVSEIKSILTKGNGKFVTAGAVSFMFRRVGLVTFLLEKYSAETLENETLESGADDFFVEENIFVVVTAVDKLQSVEEYFRKKDFLCESAELGYIPLQTATPTEENMVSLEKLLEALDEHQDVQRIWNNLP
ncbi:MAG: YebC/PmpR family DNA-binding transcriptional regulator [Candidatus Moranbacteria bacterium CG_4_10_14_3_um_filter_45_9]|nr:MAG: YebC/PmpR family DNA-binding transcriptional regulator [Candidatus Moranbacteria bacterium CG_4_10_14_3_um_filter_45_9]PJA85112.1 MAG: YebC/PmpR family DNA-binding transcriptional regulator [Candidatus Moranbacteria bacterium CG_4_9_14_3_um_filter_45_14]